MRTPQGRDSRELRFRIVAVVIECDFARDGQNCRLIEVSSDVAKLIGSRASVPMRCRGVLGVTGDLIHVQVGLAIFIVRGVAAAADAITWPFRSWR